MPQRDEVVDRLAALLKMDPAGHQRRDRRQSRLRVRPRPHRPGRRPDDRPPHLRGRLRPARGRGRRRGAPRVHRRPALCRSSSATPARSRPSSCRDLATKGYLPDDLIGKAGIEADYETRAARARTAPQSVERDATGRRTQVLQTRQPGAAGRVADADDRHPGAEGRREGAPLGDEEGRHEARRRDRDEPADRRDPRDGQPADLRQQPVRARASARKAYSKLLADKDKPLLNHAIQAHYPPGFDLQARDRHRRARATARSPPNTRVRTKGYLHARRRRSSRSGTTAAGALQHLLRLRPLERHVLLPGGRHARHRPPRLLGQAVRLRRADRHRPARARSRASSRRTPGSRTRSARRSSRARRTRPVSARATTR